MAEILGATASALTIAGVLKVCLEAFDFIRAVQRHQKDVNKLTLKLKIEKCRLLVWGQLMGLIRDDEEVVNSPLDDYPFSDLIRETLESIVDLLSNSQMLAIKYGCREAQEIADESLLLEAGPSTPSRKLHAAFSKRKLERRLSNKVKDLSKRTIWVIHDQKKFAELILDAKDFIDGLQDITKARISLGGQEHVFTTRIRTINDPETLNMIAEVCESDHPPFSDAASLRADTISMAVTEKQDIADWIDEAEQSSSLSTIVDDVESLSITDLKHRYLTLINEKSLASDQNSDAPVTDPWNLDFCRVLCDHTYSTGMGQKAGYLECVRGDLVAVLTKDDAMVGGRWQCRTRGGGVGWLPETSLQIIHTHNPAQESAVKPQSQLVENADLEPSSWQPSPGVKNFGDSSGLAEQDLSDRELGHERNIERKARNSSSKEKEQCAQPSRSNPNDRSPEPDMCTVSDSDDARSISSSTTASQSRWHASTNSTTRRLDDLTSLWAPSKISSGLLRSLGPRGSLRMPQLQPWMDKVWASKEGTKGSGPESLAAMNKPNGEHSHTAYSGRASARAGTDLSKATTYTSLNTFDSAHDPEATIEGKPYPRADQHASWEWNFQIRNFTEYYIKQNRSLEEAAMIMSKKHGFHATPGQYTGQLVSRGLQKEDR